MSGRKFIFIAIAACLAISLGAPVGRADAQREYQLKAAFIYNFVQFVDWPVGAFEDARSPIVLATVGEDPFQGALDRAIGGKKVGGRPLVVKHFAKGLDVKGCQLIFIPEGQEEQFAVALQTLGNAPVLTVGETEGFAREGGMIRFYEEDNRLRFEINPNAAQKVGLRISSRLLKLARVRQG